MPELQDRDEMVKYVSEEIDRARELFHLKEHKLGSERDEAREEAIELKQTCQSLQSTLPRGSRQNKASK